MKVSVCITTYNHENYIARAIESVLMQQVDFDYEIIIGEDQSSDNTRNIVLDYKEKYPDRIIVFTHSYPEDYVRINGRRNFVNNIRNARGEYIALLDGDDYWTDPRKLAKEVAFLESHVDCSTVFHWVDWLEESGLLRNRAYGPYVVKDYYTVDDLLECSNFIPTCSVMFRAGLFDEFPDWFYVSPFGDLPLHVLNARHGRIGFIDESMAVYRLHAGGIYSRKTGIQKLVGKYQAHDLIAVNLDYTHNPHHEKYMLGIHKDIMAAVGDSGPAEAMQAVDEAVAGYPGYLALRKLQAELRITAGDFKAARLILSDVLKDFLEDQEAKNKLALTDMNVSVVICTYNRSALLRDSVRSVQKQKFPSDKFEIIVVDNNSTDDTRQVVAEISASSCVPVEYVFEGRQGLSFARNAGIVKAKGEIIVFTDDDIEADESWLASLFPVFEMPDVAAAGGPIRPIWLGQRPSWLTDDWLGYLTVSEFSGAVENAGFKGPDYPWGANIAFHRDVFKTIGLFPTDLGRRGACLLSNEEINLCRKIEEGGKRISFSPNAIIHHKIPVERLTKLWFYHRTFWQGRSEAISDIESKVDVYSRLRDFASKVVALRKFNAGDDFQEECIQRIVLGYLYGVFLSRRGENDFRALRPLYVFLSEVRERGGSALAMLETRLAELEGVMGRQVEQLAERDRQLAEKDRQLAERASQLAESNGQLAVYHQQVRDRDEQLAEKNRELEISHHQLHKRGQQLTERDRQLAEKEKRIHELLNSASWKITAPFRWLFASILKKR